MARKRSLIRLKSRRHPRVPTNSPPRKTGSRDQGRNLPLRFSRLRPLLLGERQIESSLVPAALSLSPEKGDPNLSFSQFFPDLRGIGRNLFPIGRYQEEELNFSGKTLIEFPQNRFPPFPRFSLRQILDFRKKGQQQGGLLGSLPKNFRFPGPPAGPG